MTIEEDACTNQEGLLYPFHLDFRRKKNVVVLVTVLYTDGVENVVDAILFLTEFWGILYSLDTHPFSPLNPTYHHRKAEHRAPSC